MMCRRSVSSLLQSDFGSRLDQLMQSYVNRQDQLFESENEWMQDHNQQQSLDENVNGIDASPQTHADHDLHSVADSQFHDSDYHLSTVSLLLPSLKKFTTDKTRNPASIGFLPLTLLKATCPVQAMFYLIRFVRSRHGFVWFGLVMG